MEHRDDCEVCDMQKLPDCNSALWCGVNNFECTAIYGPEQGTTSIMLYIVQQLLLL